MSLYKSLIVVLLLLLAVQFASAATVKGSIYDSSLNEISGAVVEVNSTPAQKYVSKDGDYSFTLPKGDYALNVSYKNREAAWFTDERLSINDQGEYLIDLIMLPDLSEESQLLDESSKIEASDVSDLTDGGLEPFSFMMLAFVIAIAVFLITAQIMIHSRKKKEYVQTLDVDSNSDNDAATTEILEFIRKNSGRITQKEIRQEFPHSEAKISLLLAELEHNGRIKKIKKGRGNIIILNK